MKRLTLLSLSLLALPSSLIAHPSSLLAHSAYLPQRWDVDLAAQPPKVFTLQRPRGETYDIEAVLNIRGKPFAPAITNACIYWQTNGMENLYWSAPADVSNNCIRASWLPSMDPGAATVRGYIGDPGHVYAAAFQFRFISSPGAHPNDLPLPTPVIDFSRVTVLNPPWSGGGSGGVDTNAVIDIVRKTVDGAAKMLPKHLWCMDFDDSYPDDAAWYYAQPQDYGSCSAVRDGGFLSRNYDWKFDDASEFVVRMSAGPGRFASVGVANCGTNLTDEIVTSGKPSRYYKCLPGRTVDGINANGVCAEVNVVGGDPGERWDNPDGDIHPLSAVRWALDNATSAGMAASNLASRIAFPPGWSQNFHWMLADSAQTWIVEDGACSNVTGRTVMTNFPLLPTPTYGPGWERYMLLQDSFANITNAWFTRAYSHETEWVSEFHGTTEMYDAKELWNNGNGKESHRGQHDGNVWWWQTVHTSVYDLTNRTLRICVQETPDWYVFAVPSAGGVKPEAVKALVEPMIGAATNGIPEQIAALQDGKRDKTDLAYQREDGYTDNWEPNFVKSGEWEQNNIRWDSEEGGWVCSWTDGFTGGTVRMYGDWQNRNATTLSFYYIPHTTTHRVPRFVNDAIALVSQLPSADQLLTAEQRAQIAKVKDKADEFTEWAFGGSDRPIGELTLSFEYIGLYIVNINGMPSDYVAQGTSENVRLDFYLDGDPVDFHATRKRVLRTGDAATPQELTASISTNNPEFVSAVLATPSPYLRQYDSVLHCWWIGRMVNGVIEWEVE